MPVRTILPLFQCLFFLTTIVLFLLGVFGYLYRHESNYCEMTYMFENPVYHHISMPDVVEKRYRRYSLYSYCEGVRCEAHRRNQFTGSPVLFIVGNADSYRQVRSLGSVAYRMGENQKQLDYFSIDFNEELSALFGSVLEQQTEFVAHAIQRILSLYKKEKKIILVGNSIGGLLSRAVFLQPSDRFNPKSVLLIITQATPHQAPVIHSDSYIMDFYSRVNQYWINQWNHSLEHLVLVSLAGGDRDHLVRSDLCSLHGLTDSNRSIDVLTSAVPHVWTSTDHRCIVWCRQLVLTTTRALLEIIRENNPNPQTMMKILQRYFSPSIDIQSGITTKLNLPKEPIPILESYVSLHRKGQDDTYSISVKDSNYQTIVIHGTNMRIYLQNNDGIIDISNTMVPIPPTYGNRKMFRIEVKNLDKYETILIQLENSKSQVDVYQLGNDQQIVELSTFGSATLTFTKSAYQKLVFPTLTHLWQVYQVHLSSNDDQVPLIHFHVPWSNEDLYNLVSLRNPSSPTTTLSKSLHRQMRLKIHRPPRFTRNQYPSLELYLDPNSSYTLHITFSFLDILSQLIRYYIFLLPTFLFTVLCISYSLQVKHTNLRTYQTMLAWQVHVPMMLSINALYKIIITLFPSSNFVVNIHSNGYYFFFLPIIFYSIALSIWALISFIIDCVLLDPIYPIFFPIFNQIQMEFNRQMKYTYLLQCVALALPLLATFLFSGSNGHITLFLIALAHTIWRRTINRRLRDILTTLLLFHGLLVILHLTGLIIHIRSVVIQGLYPLYLLMSDPSLISAVFCILGFYVRFISHRSLSRFFQTIKSIFHRYSQIILIVLAISAQFLCSYSMYYLWIFILMIFIHAAMVFFIPVHQE